MGILHFTYRDEQDLESPTYSVYPKKGFGDSISFVQMDELEHSHKELFFAISELACFQNIRADQSVWLCVTNVTQQ